MRETVGKLAVVVATVAWIGCSPSDATLGNGAPNPSAGGGGGAGGSAPDPMSNGGGGGAGAGDPMEDGGNCGVERFKPQRLPPHLMIVLDQSGSMEDGNKWGQVTMALKQTVTATQADIGWGIEYFPIASDLFCSVGGQVEVPVALNNAGAISSSIDAHVPKGGTPTDGAIRAGAKYLAGLTSPNPKYMLLATDGLPTCSTVCTCPDGKPSTLSSFNGSPTCCTTNGGSTTCNGCPLNDSAPSINALTEAATAGIHTFVIGVGLTSAEASTLDQMAVAGKEPRPSTPRHYPAANQAELVTAISSISKGIISCTYALSQPPPNPSFVGVTVNGAKATRDTTHADGWDFGGGNLSIQFYGPTCDLLKQGVADVTVVFGCGPIN